MRQRIIENLPRDCGDSDALSPVERERFLVYVMGPYRTFDVEALLPDDADSTDDALPSFATWNERSGSYAEDDVLRLLQETRDCLRERGFNAFLAIDVGIDLEEMDAATQSIEFARASNATVFVAPAVGDNLGVGIEIGSVLEDMLGSDADGDPADANPPRRAERFMVATEPDVRSAMLGAVHTRWDGSVRTFDDATALCRLCAQFCTHVQNEELYGDLRRLD
ncbi:hypothetical protein NP511_03470 [Natrinema thermotolerans]|uniref:DUF7509 domain-containing protein n=1 Tax=Natrinema thermotolerans TaxID=121872 RepID=A0AAF0PDX2_9EURY|nr:hypothetical protein [Natrinema thermotolerans]QCC57621.1 hypothetical protein DVR14_02770 [Natrinema thermotolerans]WMT08699.1 hypothetical protein NP511_03470 [Natrinema thermotolerans]